jgi:hypothetical protein
MPAITVTTSKTAIFASPQGLRTLRVQNNGPGIVYYEVTPLDSLAPAAGTSPSIAANSSVFVDVYQATLYGLATANSTVVFT